MYNRFVNSSRLELVKEWSMPKLNASFGVPCLQLSRGIPSCNPKKHSLIAS